MSISALARAANAAAFAVQKQIVLLAVDAGDEIGDVNASDQPICHVGDDRVGDLKTLDVGDHLQIREVDANQDQVLVAHKLRRRRVEVVFEAIAIGQAGHPVGDDRSLEFGLKPVVGFDLHRQFAAPANAVDRHADPKRQASRDYEASPRGQDSRQHRPGGAERPELQLRHQQKRADARHRYEFNQAFGLHKPPLPRLDLNLRRCRETRPLCPDHCGQFVHG